MAVHAHVPQQTLAPGDTSSTVPPSLPSLGGMSGNSSDADKVVPNFVGALLSAENILKTEQPSGNGNQMSTSQVSTLPCHREVKRVEEAVVRGKSVLVAGEDVRSPISRKRARAPESLERDEAEASEHDHAAKKREMNVSETISHQVRATIDVREDQKPGEAERTYKTIGVENEKMRIERMEVSPPVPADLSDKGDGGSRESSEKLQSSSAGSSGEEADIDSCSGGSGNNETGTRKAHKGRAAVVCKDGHVPPAVHQHEGDCMVASRLLALWNATPVVTKRPQVAPKESRAAPASNRQNSAPPVTC